MKSPSWGTPSGDTENSLWMTGGSRRRWGAGRRAPRRGKGTSPGGRAGAQGRLYLQGGRDGRLRCESGGGSAAGSGGGRRGPEGRRAPQGRPRHRAAGAHGAGWHPGGRPGGASPSPARRRRSCSSPWRGRRSPEAAPGAQLRPGAPRHASRRAPGEGAAWPRTTRRRRQQRRRRARSQEAARFGAGAGHIPRRWWRRLRGSGSAPAAAAAPQRKGAGGGGGTSPWPPPPTTRAQSLSRSLSRAAAAASSSAAPRASPIRLPAPSATPSRADGGATAARTRPGPWARAGACAAPGPFRGGTEAAVLPRGERASEAGAPEDPAGPQPKGSRLASGPARHGERLGTPPESLTRSFLGLWWMLILPRRKRAC